jgi:hypothetical protein
METNSAYICHTVPDGRNEPSHMPSRQMGHTNAKIFKVYSKWSDGAANNLEKAKMDAWFSGRTKLTRNVPRAHAHFTVTTHPNFSLFKQQQIDPSHCETEHPSINAECRKYQYKQDD